MARLTPQSASRELDHVLVRSVAWVAGARWLAQVVRWGSTLVVARLLSPSDYGVVGIAMVLIGLVNQVAEFGLGAAVVQRRDLTDEIQDRLAGMAVVIAAGLALLTALTAPALASFYSQDALIRVVPALSLRFLIDAFATVPRAILSRELRFRTLAILESTESLVMAVTGLTLAFAFQSPSGVGGSGDASTTNGGYWALVGANLVSGVVFAMLANRQVRSRPRWPGRLGDLRPLLRFGRDLVASRLAWFTYSNADFMVVGRLLSQSALGVYSVAWNLASLPAEKFGNLILSVAPAVFSSAKSDPSQLRRLFLGMVQGIALVTFPMAIGLAVTADTVVLSALGAKWREAIEPLRILSLFFAFRSVVSLGPVVLLARQEPHIDRNMNVVLALVMPVAFVVAARWGITGVAAAWLVVMPVVSLPMRARFIWRNIGVTPSDWMRAMWPAASAAAVMTMPVLVIASLRPVENRLGLLLLEALAGATTYVATLWFGHRGAATSALQLIRRARPKPSVPVAELSPG